MLHGIHRYLAAIGLPARDGEHAIRRAKELVERGRVLPDTQTPQRLVALDTSGACVALVLGPGDRPISVVPYFAGARKSRAIVRDFSTTEDGTGRLVAHVATRSDNPKFEVDLLVHDLAARLDVLERGRPTSVAITALADSFTCRAPDAPPRFDGLGEGVSVVMMSPDDPARATIRGRILRTSTPINRTSRVHFQHARLDVFGLTLDVVAPEPDKDRPDEELRAEQLFEGTVLLVGTLDASRHDGTMPALRR